MNIANALTRCDEFLLDRVFQPLTDRLADKPSAFDIGISLELGAVVLLLAADIALFAVHRLSVSGGLWGALNCAAGMRLYIFMNQMRSLVRAGRANPLRLLYRPTRLLAFAISIYSVFAASTADRDGALAYALSALSNLAFVVGMYLVSCQPRPPGWRVARREPEITSIWATNPAR